MYVVFTAFSNVTLNLRPRSTSGLYKKFFMNNYNYKLENISEVLKPNHYQVHFQADQEVYRAQFQRKSCDNKRFHLLSEQLRYVVH